MVVFLYKDKHLAIYLAKKKKLQEVVNRGLNTHFPGHLFGFLENKSWRKAALLQLVITKNNLKMVVSGGPWQARSDTLPHFATIVQGHLR